MGWFHQASKIFHKAKAGADKLFHKGSVGGVKLFGKAELKDIFDEAIELDNKFLVPISNLVYDKKYQYLFVNLDEKRLFKGFDEILIQDD
jgi:hypothetical protein